MLVKPFDTERSRQRRLMLLKVRFYPNASIHSGKRWFFLYKNYRGILSSISGVEAETAGAARCPRNLGLVYVFVCRGRQVCDRSGGGDARPRPHVCAALSQGCGERLEPLSYVRAEGPLFAQLQVEGHFFQKDSSGNLPSGLCVPLQFPWLSGSVAAAAAAAAASAR